MNKRVAHIVLAVIDLAAIYACYYVYSEYTSINQQLVSTVESLTIQKPTGLFVTLIVVPVIHIVGFLDTPKQLHYLANSLLVILFISLVITGIVIDYNLEARVIQAGYVHCENELEKMSVSEFRTYRRDLQKCEH